MKRGGTCLLACAAVFFSLAAAHAEPMRIRAEGTANGTGPRAQQTALAEATRGALVQVLEAWVAHDDVRALDRILRVAPSFLQRSEILRVDVLAGSTRVEADLYFDRAALRSAVAEVMLPVLEAPPRLWLLVAPPPEVDAAFFYDELSQYLADVPIQVVGTGVGPYPLPEGLAEAAMAGDGEAARRFALSRDATVIGVGAATVEAEDPAPGTNLRRFVLDLTLRLHRGLDGERIEVVHTRAAIHGQVLGPATRLAVEDACARVAPDLQTAVTLVALSRRASDDVLLTVEAAQTRERLAALLEAIEQQPGVGETSVLYFSPALARLRLEYAHDLIRLVDTLRGQRHQGRTVQVRRALERDLVLRLAPAS